MSITLRQFVLSALLPLLVLTLAGCQSGGIAGSALVLEPDELTTPDAPPAKAEGVKLRKETVSLLESLNIKVPSTARKKPAPSTLEKPVESAPVVAPPENATSLVDPVEKELIESEPKEPAPAREEASETAEKPRGWNPFSRRQPALPTPPANDAGAELPAATENTGTPPPAEVEEPAIEPETGTPTAAEAAPESPPEPTELELEAEGETSSKPERDPHHVEAPKIRPGLIIETAVYVLGKQEISPVQRRIGRDGVIRLPIIGDVNVVNISLSEASEKVSQKYSAYIRNPDVQMRFVYDQNDSATSPWGYITVLGRVGRPGRINLPPSGIISLSEAVRQAGGFAPSAKTKAIKIRRSLGEGELEEITFDMRNMGKPGHARDLQLRANDTIFVPESWL